MVSPAVGLWLCLTIRATDSCAAAAQALAASIKGLSAPIAGARRYGANGQGGPTGRGAGTPDIAQSRGGWLSYAEATPAVWAGTAVGYGRLSEDAQLTNFTGLRQQPKLRQRYRWQAGVRRQRMCLSGWAKNNQRATAPGSSKLQESGPPDGDRRGVPPDFVVRH